MKVFPDTLFFVVATANKILKKNTVSRKFFRGSAVGSESGVVIAAVQASTVAWV